MGLGDIRVLAGILVRLTCHAAAQQTVQQNGCLRAGDVLIGANCPLPTPLTQPKDAAVEMASNAQWLAGTSVKVSPLAET